MFSEKRKRVIWPYILVVGLIFLTVLLFLYGTSLSNSDEEEFDIKKPVADSENSVIKEEDETTNGITNGLDNDLDNSSEKNYDNSAGSMGDSPVDSPVDSPAEIIEAEEKCYIIKNDGGLIKIFAVDEGKELKEVRVTEIVYDTLSMSDQLTFDEGILVKNKEELNRLMQDFES